MGLFGVFVQVLLKTIIFFIIIVVIVELLGLSSQSFISETFVSEVGFAILFFLVFIEELLFGMAKKQAPPEESHSSPSGAGGSDNHGAQAHASPAAHGNGHGSHEDHEEHGHEEHAEHGDDEHDDHEEEHEEEGDSGEHGHH